MSTRRTPPPIRSLSLPAELPQLSSQTLANGIEIQALPCVEEQNVVRVELIYAAGRIYEIAPLVSRATAKMLKTGTRNYSSEQIAERIDFLGTKIKIDDGFDYTCLNFYCLHKHLGDMLDLLVELLTQATFEEEELQKFIRRSKEHLRIDLQKGDFVAYRQFTELIFDPTHPYGYNSEPSLYEGIQAADLRSFYASHYHNEPPICLLSGNLNPQIKALVAEKLAALPTRAGAINTRKELPTLPPMRRIVSHLPLAQSQQAALRIGRRLEIERTHADYAPFLIANTILGGYFGARLMQNLREERGYTYGIYSSLDEMLHGAYFCIDTEVGKPVHKDALQQIYAEIELLSRELVAQEELQMVRNYLMGSYLSAFDGLFSLSNTVSDCLQMRVPLTQVLHIAQEIQNASAEDIRRVVQTYLQPEQLVEVVVGAF